MKQQQFVESGGGTVESGSVQVGVATIGQVGQQYDASIQSSLLQGTAAIISR